MGFNKLLAVFTCGIFLSVWGEIDFGSDGFFGNGTGLLLLPSGLKFNRFFGGTKSGKEMLVSAFTSEFEPDLSRVSDFLEESRFSERLLPSLESACFESSLFESPFLGSLFLEAPGDFDRDFELFLDSLCFEGLLLP